MKKLLVILGIFGVLVGAVVIYYFTVFSKVQFEVREFGPYKVIGKESVGPYKNVVKVITGVVDQLKKEGMNPERTVGIYYDDPRKVEESKLRAFGGVTVEPSTTTPEGLTATTIPLATYITTTYVGHPLVGVFKVYPAVHKYLIAHEYEISGPVVEMYTRADKKISTQYLVPVKKSFTNQAEK